uniref:G protein-coupled receptor n=2 Tax=Caenorhabditis tropicalis TaxID=1561998 RepID=A0A1I7TC56_9PELO
MGHSGAIALITIAQLLSHKFSESVSCHINGSLQVLSIVPTLVYYHLLVINYKYRFLEVRHRGHSDYTGTYFLELLSGTSYIAYLLYFAFLFCAEVAYPKEMYLIPAFDQNIGMYGDNFATFALVLSVIATCLLVIDLFRIARNSYRIYHVEVDIEQTNQYWFRKWISQNIEPHFVNDFITLYLPAQYLVLCVSPSMVMDGFILLSKCLLIAHPIVFLIIYMVQIKLATRMVKKEEMECRCCVCRKKDESRRTLRTDSRFIKLKVMRSGARKDNGAVEERRREDGGEGEGEELRGGAAAADEQPTETTMYTTQISVSEDL